ncbi:hypothetical protein D3C85_1339570 [compost metagenome]
MGTEARPTQRNGVPPPYRTYGDAELEGDDKQGHKAQRRQERLLTEPVEKNLPAHDDPQEPVDSRKKTETDGGNGDRCASPPPRLSDHRDR